MARSADGYSRSPSLNLGRLGGSAFGAVDLAPCGGSLSRNPATNGGPSTISMLDPEHRARG